MPHPFCKKDGLFCSDAEKSQRHCENGDLHFITFSCDQKKEDLKDSIFQ